MFTSLSVIAFTISTFSTANAEWTWTSLDYPDQAARNTEIYATDGARLVGTYHHVDSGGQRGFVYDGANWFTLDYPGSIHETTPTGVEGSRIVGTHGDGDPGIFGFILEGTQWTNLVPPGGAWTEVTGIEGSTLVGSYPRTNGGFIYDIATSTWTDLNYQGPGIPTGRTYPSGISGGRVAGTFIVDHDDIHEFVYDPVTGFTLLDYPDARQTYLAGISGDRLIGSYELWDGTRGNFLYEGGNWYLWRIRVLRERL